MHELETAGGGELGEIFNDESVDREPGHPISASQTVSCPPSISKPPLENQMSLTLLATVDLPLSRSSCSVGLGCGRTIMRLETTILGLTNFRADVTPAGRYVAGAPEDGSS